jgi:hypothetical protein
MVLRVCVNFILRWINEVLFLRLLDGGVSHERTSSHGPEPCYNDTTSTLSGTDLLKSVLEAECPACGVPHFSSTLRPV